MRRDFPIFSSAIGGTPDYEYSLDGINFQPNPRFPELAAGDYLLFVRDIKGCIDSINVSLNEPPPLIVQAGPDVTIDLGTSTTFNASYSPPDADVMIEWSNPETIEGWRAVGVNERLRFYRYDPGQQFDWHTDLSWTRQQN